VAGMFAAVRHDFTAVGARCGRVSVGKSRYCSCWGEGGIQQHRIRPRTWLLHFIVNGLQRLTWDPSKCSKIDVCDAGEP
jgi:hypothetical protein